VKTSKCISHKLEFILKYTHPCFEPKRKNVHIYKISTTQNVEFAKISHGVDLKILSL
jgi:hypothetical protein